MSAAAFEAPAAFDALPPQFDEALGEKLAKLGGRCREEKEDLAALEEEEEEE